jgi:methyl-accepting chemotaxis protein
MATEHGPLLGCAESVVQAGQSLTLQQDALAHAWDRLQLLLTVALESSEGAEPDSAIGRMIGTLEEVIVDIGNAAGAIGSAAGDLVEAIDLLADAEQGDSEELRRMAGEIEPRRY